jgi:hypothetical protein
MNDVKVGAKFAPKHIDKAMKRLQPFLQQGEEVTFLAHLVAGRKGGDTIVITNQRLITVWKFTTKEFEFSCPLEDIVRITFSGSRVTFDLANSEKREIGKLMHASSDEALIRAALPLLFNQTESQVSTTKKVIVPVEEQVTYTAESVQPLIYTDENEKSQITAESTEPAANIQANNPFENIEFGPKTKEKDWLRYSNQVSTSMHEGERAFGVVGSNNDWYVVTNYRLLYVAGIRRKITEIDLTSFNRTFVQKQTIRWWIAGADSKQNFSKIGHFSDESCANWLAHKIERSYPQFNDPWRDELRGLLRQLNLTYAFEGIYPILVNQISEEKTLGGLGVGENVILLTSERVVVLPELISVAKAEVSRIEFAVGRQEHSTWNGHLLKSAIKVSVEVYAVDGRRYGKLCDMGESQEQYNRIVPGITSMKQKLQASGYSVTDGPDWMESTQGPIPQQQSSTFIGYSFDV